MTEKLPFTVIGYSAHNGCEVYEFVHAPTAQHARDNVAWGEGCRIVSVFPGHIIPADTIDRTDSDDRPTVAELNA